MNTDMTTQISRINPVPGDTAADLVSRDTFAHLAEQIMATADGQDGQAGRIAAAPRTRRARVRRRLLVAIPATAAIAAAAVAVSVFASPGQKVGPVTVGPASAQALSFTRDGGYLVVIVRNPVADEATYRAEFAAHHLHITFTLVPVSKDLVGTLVYMGTPNNGGGIITITDKGHCWTGGGGNECPVGVKVPLDFHGQAEFTFGRAARPGELYESSDQGTAPGEALYGIKDGESLVTVLAILHSRHQSVQRFSYLAPGRGLCGKVPYVIPRNWRVYMSMTVSSDQVILWVGPPVTSGHGNCDKIPATAPGTHLAAPSPSASAVNG
jgi:hypothetical protein